MTIIPKYFLVLEVGFWLPVCLLLAACGLGSGGWCGCSRYGLFRFTWMMLQIVSYIDYYSVYTFNIHAPYFFSRFSYFMFTFLS